MQQTPTQRAALAQDQAANAHVHPLFAGILNAHAAASLATAQAGRRAELQAELKRAEERLSRLNNYGTYEEASRYHDAFMEVARLQTVLRGVAA